MILFLTENRTEPNKYQLVFEVSGAFEATDGKIRPLLKGDWMMKAERGSSKTDFMKRVYEALQGRS